MKKILVATDGSTCSLNATNKTKTLAESMGSNVTIITVGDTSNLKSMDGETGLLVKDSISKNAKNNSDKTLKAFQDFSGEVNTLIKFGDPAEEIIKEAEEGNYDLIVMGCRGEETFFTRILGSTTNKVLNNLNKTILTVE